MSNSPLWQFRSTHLEALVRLVHLITPYIGVQVSMPLYSLCLTCSIPTTQAIQLVVQAHAPYTSNASNIDGSSWHDLMSLCHTSNCPT